jgi:hypothetical protein
MRGQRLVLEPESDRVLCQPERAVSLLELSHGLTLQSNAMGVVDDAVQDDVGNRRFAKIGFLASLDIGWDLPKWRSASHNYAKWRMAIL